MRSTGPALTRFRPVVSGTLSERTVFRYRLPRQKRRELLGRASLAGPIGRLPLPRRRATHGRDDAGVLADINTMVVRCYFDAFNERRLDTCLTTHSPDWVGRFRPGSHALLHGRDVNLARMQSLIDEFPEIQIRVANRRVVGDLIVVRFCVTGHGGDADPPGFGVLRLERGRIIDEYVVNPLLGRHAKGFAQGMGTDLEVA